MMSQYCVGILALQGGFVEHQSCLEALGVRTVLVRSSDQLEGLQGLILPGGESSAIASLIEWDTWRGALKEAYEQGMVVWGTCAGAILLSMANQLGYSTFFSLDLDVERNAYGRQMSSFVATIETVMCTGGTFKGVFIRAPKLLEVQAPLIALAWLGGEVVAVGTKRMLITTFHPELSDDSRIHQFFLSLVKQPDWQVADAVSALESGVIV